MRIDKETKERLIDKGWSDREICEYVFLTGKVPPPSMPKSEIRIHIKDKID